MEVIAMIIALWCVSFVLILRKRGIILYLPNKRTKGTITKIITKHRTSMEPKRGKNRRRRQMDIVEAFVEVEFYDGSRKMIAESMFPVHYAKVGDEVVVRYRKGYERKVWVSESK